MRKRCFRKPFRRLATRLRLESLEARRLLAMVTLDSVRDNTIYEHASGLESNGAGTFFFAGRSGQSQTLRGLVRFDVASAIPSGATINSVALTLQSSTPQNRGTQTIGLHKTLSDWGEGTSHAPMGEAGGAPAAPGDATWIHTFFSGSTWASAGGDFSSTVSASISVGAAGSYTWSSTAQLVADVQAWIDTPSSNFGWMLRGNETTNGAAKRFNTREFSTASQRPKLTIDYTEPVAAGAVAGRHLFYNDSSFDAENPAATIEDDAAIASDKQALLPGATSMAENFSSYTEGINGIMVDLDRDGGGAMTAADFEFKIGNDDNPAAWLDAPDPSSVTVRPIAGGLDRVTILWNNGAIQNQWLQIRVLANGNTTLADDDLFYFGNQLGDASGEGMVNAIDFQGARANPATFVDPATIDNRYDFDRNTLVDAGDLLVVRENATALANGLRMISVPASASQPTASVSQLAIESESAGEGELDSRKLSAAAITTPAPTKSASIDALMASLASHSVALESWTKAAASIRTQQVQVELDWSLSELLDV